MTYLSSKFFTANRQSLAKMSDAKLIVIAANGLLQSSGSVTYDFQQDSNFFYLSGVNEPNMVFAMNIESGEEILIRGQQTEVGEIFDGSAKSEALTSISGIEQILSHDEGWVKLEAWIKDLKTAHIVQPPESYVSHYSMYTNPARAALKRQLKRLGAEIDDIFPELSSLRNIKQPEEIAALRQAINITGQTIEMVQANIKKYNYEYEIDADIVASFRKLSLSRPGYQCMIASGQNACTLHYMGGNDKINKSRTLLVDVGAQVEHYSADITRVFLPNNTRAKEVHAAVAELQKIALDIVKPGVNFIDYEQTMVKHYGEKLIQLGLIKAPLEKTIRKFMPHGTSHFLGLDVHDVGDYHQAFKPGMVITIEPGFYVPDEAIGIRIEDDILITHEGNEVLSKDIPTNLSLS